MDIIVDSIWSWWFLPGMLLCGLWLTVRCRALQFRCFKLSLSETIGKAFHRKETTAGTVSPLQAASTALASTLGTGNIVGTAQAICMGGPGALFWLWVTAMLGMIIKYAEILLTIRFREKKSTGGYSGGPMYYIKAAFGGKLLPAFYALFAALAALGMGNMTQVSTIADTIGAIALSPGQALADERLLRLLLGLLLAAIVALILSGGAKGVGKAAERLVPFMSVVFLLATGAVIICNLNRLPLVFRQIITCAFSQRAMLGATGGLITGGCFHWGVRRSAFSNEAGLGRQRWPMQRPTPQTPLCTACGAYSRSLRTQ